MNEHDAAKAISTGDLPSPTRFGNFVFVALRVTGTGTAHRTTPRESVYRDPAIWLTDATLERLRGLPVIVQHPQGALNPKEYARRAVGNVQFAYIADRDGFANQEGPDVWAVTRLYSDDVIQAMLAHQLSTSPAVEFCASDGNATVKLGDGTDMLIEGAPSLIDHIAICEAGVWDKGAEPSGIRIDDIRKENTMTEEETAAEAARKDQEGPAAEKPPANDPLLSYGQTLDKVLDGLTSISKRLDALETKPRAHDEDGNPRAPGEPRPVAAKADADESYLERAERERQESAEKSDIQARADSLCRAHGSAAPPWMMGETPFAYRRRLARGLQRHSKDFANIDLYKMNAGDVFDAIEGKIYADATVAACSPEFVPGGPLRELTKVDPATGVRVTTFHGDHTFIRDMKSRGRRARLIMKPNG